MRKPERVNTVARTRKADEQQKPYVLPDTETRPIKCRKGIAPPVMGTREIMGSEEKRDFAAEVLSSLSKTMLMPRVQSNAELVDRLDQYFQMCVNQKIPPTWEGAALFCGYGRSMFWEWMSKRKKGFPDPVDGLYTDSIIKRAREIFAAYDGTMAISGKINPVAYIYRSTNFYGMVNKQSVALEPITDQGSSPRTPEEIARDLPDLLDDDGIDAEYRVE